MRKITRSIIAVALAAGLLTAMRPAFAGNADENDFFNRINAERTSRGLKTLTLTTDLSGVARNHSQDMASNNRLYHNENLGNEVSGWEELGENVGEGGSVADLHAAFMNSSVHRAEILGNYTKIGIGTVWKDGILWVTEVFFRPQQASQPAPQTASQPRPQPVTSTSARAPIVRQRVAPIRAAGSVPVGARPVAPSVPVGIAIPLTPGRLQMMLGDLVSIPSDEPFDGSGDGRGNPLPDDGLDALLWRAATRGGVLPGQVAA